MSINELQEFILPTQSILLHFRNISLIETDIKDLIFVNNIIYHIFFTLNI